MTEKSSKSDFNKAKGSTEKKNEPDYSHKQVIEKTDMYAKFAKTGEQQKNMRDIKDKYVKRKEELQQRRYTRNRNYFLGRDANIHPEETLKRLERQDKQQDQRMRNRTMKEAKSYYHRNYSLSKTTFKETANKTKTKDQSMDKS